MQADNILGYLMLNKGPTEAYLKLPTCCPTTVQLNWFGSVCMIVVSHTDITSL